MEFSIKFDTRKSGWSIVYIMVSQAIIVLKVATYEMADMFVYYIPFINLNKRFKFLLPLQLLQPAQGGAQGPNLHKCLILRHTP